MPLFVGVDGGASRSRAVALDEAGRELARAEGPAAALRDGGLDGAMAAVETVVREVVARAGGSPPVAGLVAGLAGAGRPAARDAARELLAVAGLAVRVDVRTDAAVALADAFDGGAGILLVAGTGSVAQGRAGDGREARAGGHGAPAGDEGSGWWVGLAGVRAVARAADGRGPATALTDHLPAAAGLAGPDDLLRWATTAGKREVAALAPAVLGLADAGDAVAAGIAARAVAELAGLADAVRRALDPWPDAPAVAAAGGLIEAGGLLRGRLGDTLAGAGLTLDPRPVDAARGAARAALAMAGAASTG